MWLLFAQLEPAYERHKTLWGPLEDLLGRSWGPLGPSWGPLGPSSEPLGASWGVLGALRAGAAGAAGAAVVLDGAAGAAGAAVVLDEGAAGAASLQLVPGEAPFCHLFALLVIKQPVPRKPAN